MFKLHLQQTLEKYLPTISNMLVPASIFAFGLFSFLINDGFSFADSKIFHWSFYALVFTNLVILLNFNLGCTLFSTIIISIGYISINYLKNRYGNNYFETIWYEMLCILIPLNLLASYLYYSKKFLSRKSLWILIIILIEYSIVEQLGYNNINLKLAINNINVIALIGFVVLILWTLTNSIKTGKMLDYSFLYSSISVGLGIYYSSNFSGLSLFFFMSQLFLSIYLVYSLSYNHFYDETTGIYSRNSYLIQSKNFPLKYSLGIVSIDNYDKLGISFGTKKQRIITSLIVEVLQTLITDQVIFRYAPDQFIILYKTMDKKEAFTHLDEIRRSIARMSFSWSKNQKSIKLTVSCSVADKKRSDAGAVEVLMRADKAMRKTLKFSHNVTSQG